MVKAQSSTQSCCSAQCCVQNRAAAACHGLGNLISGCKMGLTEPRERAAAADGFLQQWDLQAHREPEQCSHLPYAKHKAPAAKAHGSTPGRKCQDAIPHMEQSNTWSPGIHRHCRNTESVPNPRCEDRKDAPAHLNRPVAFPPQGANPTGLQSPGASTPCPGDTEGTESYGLKLKLHIFCLLCGLPPKLA